MGMAASQARFLQLTARKNNIEYQGQQINQARLALANASAGLFEKMLSMEVPTPPSSQDAKYITQGYIYSDKTNGTSKKISWDNTTVDADSFKVLGSSDSITIKRNTVAAEGISISTDPITSTASLTRATILDAVGEPADSDKMKLVTTALNIALPESAVAEIKNVTISYQIYNPDGDLETVEEKSPALIIFDNMNRAVSVTLLDNTSLDTSDKRSAADSNKYIYNPTFSSQFDEDAYNDDMNKYEFQKSAYDYQIEQINLETKRIQVQDRSLELKMKQLDTEHNAIQTEMDAVQKVMQKNIESTFKTFS